MEVNNNSTGGSISALAAGGQGSAVQDLGFETFLKLLVTQLENQDPLNPMDGTAFTEQLATFSQLEQQVLANEKLEELTQARDFSSQTLAVSYIGHQVLAPVGQEFAPINVTLLEEGAEVEFGYDLTEQASDASVEIRDSDGVLVRTIDSNTAKGATVLTWDGLDDAGEAVPAGEYTVRLTAKKLDGEKVAYRMMSYAEVDGVAADEESVTLNLVDGRNVFLEDVLQVKATPAS
jgi:flagellar basal-body rod modification protein FlgD